MARIAAIAKATMQQHQRKPSTILGIPDLRPSMCQHASISRLSERYYTLQRFGLQVIIMHIQSVNLPGDALYEFCLHRVQSGWFGGPAALQEKSPHARASARNHIIHSTCSNHDIEHLFIFTRNSP
jgi:hypothetical protein